MQQLVQEPTWDQTFICSSFSKLFLILSLLGDHRSLEHSLLSPHNPNHTNALACLTSTIIHLPHQLVHLLQLILTNHHHPKSTVHIRIHFSGVCSVVVNKCLRTHMHYNNIIQSVFIMLKVLCAHLFILFYSPLNPGKQTSFYCLHNFTFSRMPCSWNHTSCSLFRAPLLHLFYSFTSVSLQSCLTLFRPHRL